MNGDGEHSVYARALSALFIPIATSASLFASPQRVSLTDAVGLDGVIPLCLTSQTSCRMYPRAYSVE